MKKKIISTILIILLLTNNVFATDFSNNNFDNFLEELFPMPFYKNNSLYENLEKNNLLPENIISLNEKYNIFVAENLNNINTYLYARNLDNFVDEPIYPFDNFLEINNQKIPIENDNEFISNYYNKNYLKLNLENDLLNIESINTNSHTWSLIFYDKNGKEINLSFLSTMRIWNNRFYKNFKFYNFKNIDSFTITLNKHELNKYYPNPFNFKLKKDSEILEFENPETYENNKEIYYNSYYLSPDDFLGLEHLSEDEQIQMKKIAKDITKNLNTDYEKLLAIHKWVSNNIYYDFDSLKYNNRGPNDAYNTFTDKRAICQGYAELSLALCRSIDIPTKLIYGYALGVVSGENNWNEISLNAPLNHAWNEAYIDGRWVIFDTTWDSSNRYEESEFIEKEGSLKYFDPSLKAFSQTHKIMEIIEIE